MDKPTKTRLCWNCEGRVSQEAETCPYCGVSVVPASLDNVNASFTPPYRMGATQETAIPRSPYVTEENDEQETRSEEVKEVVVEMNAEAFDEFQRSLWATVLLLMGSVFFLFGLVLVLFSQHGVFTLQWNGSTWFYYLILALPLLFFGWRNLSNLKDD